MTTNESGHACPAPGTERLCGWSSGERTTIAGTIKREGATYVIGLEMPDMSGLER